MGKTTQVAADRAYDQTKTVLPAEVAQGVYMQNAPGLAALKLMHLMIGTAGGRMADDVQHTITLADIRKIDGMDNHTAFCGIGRSRFDPRRHREKACENWWDGR